MIIRRLVSSIFFLAVWALIALAFSAAPAHAQNVQVDLSNVSNLCAGKECFNLAGLFDTGVKFLGTTGMDNGNNCTPTAPYTNCPDAYSANQLGLSSTAPYTLTPASVSAPFTFGPVNTSSCGPSVSGNPTCSPNVVNLTTAGVAIALPSSQQTIYSTMIMLGTAVNGHHNGKVTASYTDGSSNVFSQGFSDWCSFGGNQYESIAVGGFNRLNSDGTLNGASCNLYAYTYPLDFTKTLAGITLTDGDGSGAMFGLAITLKPPTYTIDGGAASPTSIGTGSSATATITVNPQPGYIGTVNLSCSIVPTISTSGSATAPSCSLSPASVTVTTGETSPPTSTLTFNAAAAPKTTKTERHSGFFYALWLPLPGLALVGISFGSSRRKHLLGLLLLGLLLAGVIATPACVSYTHLGNVGTPPGQYTIAVTGMDTNNLSQASNPAGTTNTVTVTVSDN